MAERVGRDGGGFRIDEINCVARFLPGFDDILALVNAADLLALLEIGGGIVYDHVAGLGKTYTYRQMPRAGSLSART